MSWKVKLTKQQFEELKTDEKFSEILCLARVVNSLRFITLSGLSTQDGSSANRNSTNSFLIALGILHEGFRVVDRLGKYFNNYKSFKDGFVKLRKSEVYKNLQGPIISGVRNNISFHFYSDVIRTTLKNLDLTEYVLASGDDETWKELHYDLADLTVINTICESSNRERVNDEEFFIKVVMDTSMICMQFVEAADMLIGEYIRGLNLNVEQG